MDELMSLLDEVKMKLTDNEYKVLADKIADLQKKKNEKKSVERFYIDVLLPINTGEETGIRNYKMKVEVDERTWDRFSQFQEINFGICKVSYNDWTNISNFGADVTFRNKRVMVVGRYPVECILKTASEDIPIEFDTDDEEED